MHIFSRDETKAVLIILLVISLFSLFNFRLALRRGRDNERENDVGDIYTALNEFQAKFGGYPPSTDDGHIVGCGDVQKISEMHECVWGHERLSSNSRVMPADPGTAQGYAYRYISDGKHFQILTSLEGGADEDQYNAKIVARNLMCGTKICSFGKASGNTPLDISLQEYENKLNAK